MYDKEYYLNHPNKEIQEAYYVGRYHYMEEIAVEPPVIAMLDAGWNEIHLPTITMNDHVFEKYRLCVKVGGLNASYDYWIDNLWNWITSGYMSELDAYVFDGEGGKPYAIKPILGSNHIIIAEPFHVWVQRFMNMLMKMLGESKMVARVEIGFKNGVMTASTDTWKEK